jgi:hypothetical protein
VLALANKHTFVKNPKGRSRPSPKRDYIAAWLKTYFEEVGDFEPTTGTLCLFVGVVVSLATKFSLVYCAGEVRISYAKRVDIKNEMLADFSARPDAAAVFVKKVHTTYFNTIWREEFPNVHVSKYSKNKKCTRCAEFYASLEKTKNWNERVELKAARRKHIEEVHLHKLRTVRAHTSYILYTHHTQVRIERRHYHNNRDLASAQPDKYVSVIIDGMDQSKTAVPKMKRVTDDDGNGKQLKVHVTGVLVHGQAVPAHVFTSTSEWPSDTNQNIHILVKVLERIGWDYLKGKTLLVQMDNTQKDNKNFLMMEFFATLVATAAVKDVSISVPCFKCCCIV